MPSHRATCNLWHTKTLTTFVLINLSWYWIPVYLQNILKYQNIPLDNLMFILSSLRNFFVNTLINPVKSEVEWGFFISWKNCESWSVSEFYIHSFQSLVNTFKKMSETSKMMWYDFHPMSYMCYLSMHEPCRGDRKHSTRWLNIIYHFETFYKYL